MKKSTGNKSKNSSSQNIDLKDKYENGEMDLSMCDIQEVPIKNIVSYIFEIIQILLQ